MPCDSVSRMQVDLKVADRNMMKAGLKAAGWQVTERGNVLYVISPIGTAVEIHPTKAVIVSRGRTVDKNYQAEIVSQIKVAYSAEVVRQTAAEFGFEVNTTVAQEFGGAENPQFELVRESL
jgi:hypothetical protein